MYKTIDVRSMCYNPMEKEPWSVDKRSQVWTLRYFSCVSMWEIPRPFNLVYRLYYKKKKQTIDLILVKI